MKNRMLSWFCLCCMIIGFTTMAHAEKMRLGFVGTADSSLNVPDFIKKNLKDALRQKITDSAKFEVVDRNEQDLKKLFEEMKFSDERIGRVDVNDAKKAQYGKIAGMEYMAIININDFYTGLESSKFQQTNPGSRLVTRVGASVRLINSSTSIQVSEKKVTAKKSAPAESSPTQEVSVNGGQEKKSGLEEMASKIDAAALALSGEKRVVENAAKDSNGIRVWQINTELANKAIDALAVKIVRQIVDQLYPITILDRNGSSAFINRGKDGGIKIGDLLEVAVVKKVEDLDTKEMLDLASPVGKLKITSVSEKTAQGEVIEDFGITKGCIAQFLGEGDDSASVESIQKNIEQKATATDW